MVDILTKQTTNQEFLDFAVEQVHNADIVTTHAGEPSAQVCDLLLNKNGKLYIATSNSKQKNQSYHLDGSDFLFFQLKEDFTHDDHKDQQTS